jgi:hypothetical protein
METREAFDYIVDVTIAFEKPYSGRLCEFDPPTIAEFFYPRSGQETENVKIHTYYKKYKMSEIPEDTDRWLTTVFEEKDELLKYFDKHQRFPGKGYLQKDSFWDLFMNFLFGWCVYGFIGYFVMKYVPWVFYGLIGLVCFSGLYILYYDLKHQWKHVRASKVETPETKDEKKE